MRLLIDAMCADYGGIETYVRNLIRTWPSVFPDDELHVLRPETAGEPYPAVIEHRATVPAPSAIGRPLVQTVRLRALARELDPDVVLATLPSTTVRRIGVPTTVVVYDLRHELRPEQFTRRRRVLRRLSYGQGYRVADAFIAISQRSLDDLHRLHPDTTGRPGAVVHLGGDHVTTWTLPADGKRGPAVAFGHQSNKNVDLLLDAWALLARDDADPPPLLILGLSGSDRARVEDAIAARGLSEAVRVAAFLPADEFEATLAAASLVVFPSDFEGFGLPVVEAMQLGIPIVVGPEPAVLEVAGGHATVMASWDAASLATATRSALVQSTGSLLAARAHGDTFTWSDTVLRTRVALEATCRPREHAVR